MSNTETTGTRCLRCGRQLRSPKSTTRGYGAWCQAKIRAAAITNAVTGFTTRQIEKARELITDGGLIPPAGRVCGGPYPATVTAPTWSPRKGNATARRDSGPVKRTVATTFSAQDLSQSPERA